MENAALFDFLQGKDGESLDSILSKLLRPLHNDELLEVIDATLRIYELEGLQGLISESQVAPRENVLQVHP